MLHNPTNPDITSRTNTENNTDKKKITVDTGHSVMGKIRFLIHSVFFNPTFVLSSHSGVFDGFSRPKILLIEKLE